MSDNATTFMAITGCEDSQVAEHFLEMAGDDVETAISLFFEHGPANGAAPSHTGGNAEDDDVKLAERLQNEAYQDNEPRAPDQAVHERLVDDVHVFPGQFGGIGGAYNPLANVDEMIYGRGRTAGIFNQRDNMYGEDSDEEEELLSGLTESQRRLRELFKPPFDIMSKLDLESAKMKAAREKKWVLVNIQDDKEFQCQVLNRDFWKSTTVKELVRDNFVFVQYQQAAPAGEQYCNFYPIEEVPHIAILDAITGERVKMWHGVPKVSKWCEEVFDFLNEFSVDPAAINPTVTHKPKIDLNTLSEEKQLEYAIKQSLGKSADDSDDDDVVNLDSDDDDYQGNASDPIVLDEDDEVTEVSKPAKPLTEQEMVKQINAIEHPEPSTPTTTRIQIRMGDGSRVVRKFDSEDKVQVIYEFIKHQFEDKIGTKHFTLTSQRENLFHKLDQSIADAGLKNASILLDIVDDDDEDDE